MKEIRFCISSNNKIIQYKNEKFYHHFFPKLENKYCFVEDRTAPQYIFCDEYSTIHLKYPRAIRIQCSAENVPPNFFEYDYIIGTSKLTFGDRYFHYPAYAWPLPGHRDMIEGLNDLKKLSKEDLGGAKRYFCNFVYSNHNCSQKRVKWFDEISKYKFIHAPGMLCNNTEPIPKGKSWPDTFDIKMKYQEQFKFTLACENASAVGYVSEKIFNAFRARTIPIYWGDPTISDVIDKNSFVDLGKYENPSDAIEEIRRIDEDDELYLQMVNTPPLLDVTDNNMKKLDMALLSFFDMVFSDDEGHRDCDCNLWHHRYELRYKYGANLYENAKYMYNKFYNLYKKLWH